MTDKVDYDRVAPAYDARYAQHAFNGIDAALRGFVAPGLRVLEVGCGTGHWLQQLEGWGCEVWGLDASPEMLKRAQERGLRAQLSLGTAAELPWDDASFDRVVCVNALHHFPEPPRFFAQAARVLGRGGAVLSIGMDPNAADEPWFVYDYFPRTRDLDRARYAPGAMLRGWLRDAGFVDCGTNEVEHIRFDRPARETLENGMLVKHSTSQLILLSDAEYDAGVARIRADMADAEARGGELRLTADLRLYGTSGRIPE